MSELPKIANALKEKLEASGFVITIEAEQQYGYRFTLSSGAIVTIFHTGAVSVQGKKDEKLSSFLNK